tara:strand:- start:164 stop:730 length:567 start_codon:yes stop_codon:yes gene_type:complete
MYSLGRSLFNSGALRSARYGGDKGLNDSSWNFADHFFQISVWSRSYAAAESTSTGEGLKLSLTMPHKAIFHKEQVRLVNIPGARGERGIAKDTVPLLTELKAGYVRIEHLNGNVDHYVVSPGFAIKSDDGELTLSVLEAYTVDQLDEAAIDEVCHSLILTLSDSFSSSLSPTTFHLFSEIIFSLRSSD